MENTVSAVLRGPWTAPKPPPCTSSAPGHKGQPSAFPHKCQGWITPLMQHSLCRGLQLPDTWAGVVAKGWRGHPLAELSPGTSSCTPAQAGDKASAHLTAEQEFDPAPEPSGLQSSPSLILPPAQPREMQSRMALAATTAKGCFARPSSKAEVLLGHPQLPHQPPQASRT